MSDSNVKNNGPKGLDDFAKKFLVGDTENGEEYIVATPGHTADPKAMEAYLRLRKEEFIKRAGEFTEDLVAFFGEQRKLRNVSDIEAIFALALMTINLRYHYVNNEGQDKKEREDQFDNVCYGAQQYWDSNL